MSTGDQPQTQRHVFAGRSSAIMQLGVNGSYSREVSFSTPPIAGIVLL